MSTEATLEAASGQDTSQTGQTAQTAQTPLNGQQSGINEPWAKSWIKPDFTLDSKALDRLPDHLKPLKEVLGRQRSFEDVLTVMQNQQMLAGKKGLAPLPADAPEPVKAERKALLDQINGVPPKPTDYKIERPDFVPEDQWNPKLSEATSAWAHKHSVSPAALKELTDANLALVKEQLTAQQQYETQFFQKHQQAFEAQIRQDNIALDRANSLVERGAKDLGLDPANPEHQVILKNSAVKLAMMRHAIATGEDQVVTGNSAASDVNDPGKQASDIVHNPANPLYAQYWNKEGKFTRSQNQAAVEKVKELWRLDGARKK